MDNGDGILISLVTMRISTDGMPIYNKSFDAKTLGIFL